MPPFACTVRRERQTAETAKNTRFLLPFAANDFGKRAGGTRGNFIPSYLPFVRINLYRANGERWGARRCRVSAASGASAADWSLKVRSASSVSATVGRWG